MIYLNSKLVINNYMKMMKLYLMITKNFKCNKYKKYKYILKFIRYNYNFTNKSVQDYQDNCSIFNDCAKLSIILIKISKKNNNRKLQNSQRKKIKYFILIIKVLNLELIFQKTDWMN